MPNAKVQIINDNKHLPAISKKLFAFPNFERGSQKSERQP